MAASTGDSLQIRQLQTDDWAALIDIYNHYILTSPCTFDTEPYNTEARTPWFSQFSADTPYQCLVALVDQQLLGYACSTRFKERPAYSTSVEVSVYVAHNLHNRGVGHQLYSALFDRLQEFTLHRAYAGIVLPNDASVKLHSRMGFAEAGRFREVGYKFDQYWDVAWFEKPL